MQFDDARLFKTTAISLGAENHGSQAPATAIGQSYDWLLACNNDRFAKILKTDKLASSFGSHAEIAMRQRLKPLAPSNRHHRHYESIQRTTKRRDGESIQTI